MKRPDTQNSGFIVAALGAIIVMSIFPSYLYDIGGDRLIHVYYMDCFARDFWKGVPYPRWCMEASGGLGSPAFLFYFPFPYFMASFFYPLTWAGLSMTGLQHVMLLAMTVIAACAAYRWLRPITSPQAALAGTALYMLAPYHAELFFYRSAYAELWLYAFFPLLMIQARALANNERRAWLKLAVIYTLCLMCHASTALMAGLAVAVYLAMALWQAQEPGRLLIIRGMAQAALGAFIAFAATCIYWLPGLYWRSSTVPRSPDMNFPVVDIYPSLLTGFSKGFDDRNPFRLYTGTFLTLVLISGFLIAGWRARHKTKALNVSSFAYRDELVRYIAIFAIALFFYLPIIEPLWLRSDVLQALIFPWRFQLLWVPLLSLSAACFMEAQRHGVVHVRMGDRIVLIAMLVVFSFSQIYYVLPGQERYIPFYERMKNLSVYPYAPRWTNERFGKFEAVAEQVNLPRVIKAGGKIDIEMWEAGNIRLRAHGPSKHSVVLRQLYFPAWQATVTDTDGNTVPLDLAPEDGYISFRLPAGNFGVDIRFRPYSAMVKRIRNGCTIDDNKPGDVRSGC